MSEGSRPPRIVVKLGGSLADDPALAHWLHELARNRSACFVVVPGGGPFADAVRAAQRRWRFADEVAHVMAVGAMDQFAYLLCGIEKGSLPCSTLEQIEAAWVSGRLPVWLPARLVTRDQQLPRNWDVTSDTISAWLANALGASGLVLVKSCDLASDLKDLAPLAASGVIDPGLPRFVSDCGLTLNVVHKRRWNELSQMVAGLSCRREFTR
jgi:aspartokinase-like uncharacterized kinase